MKRILIAAICAFLASIPTRAEIMAPTHFGLFFVTSSLKGPCMDSRVDLDARIAACKALADSGMPRSEHAAVLFLLGKDYREKGDYAHSIDSFAEIADLESDPAVAAYATAERAESFAASGQYEKALADADAVIPLQPDDPVSYNNRCWIRALADKDVAAALDDCNKAIAMNDLPLFRDSRGLVELRQRNYPAALADFDAVLAASPKFTSSLYLRSIAKRQSGDAKGADDDLAAAKKLVPHIADIFAPYKLGP